MPNTKAMSTAEASSEVTWSCNHEAAQAYPDRLTDNDLLPDFPATHTQKILDVMSVRKIGGLPCLSRRTSSPAGPTNFFNHFANATLPICRFAVERRAHRRPPHVQDRAYRPTAVAHITTAWPGVTPQP